MEGLISVDINKLQYAASSILERWYGCDQPKVWLEYCFGRKRRLTRRQQAQAAGAGDGLGAVLDTEFAEDIGRMSLDGAQGDVQPCWRSRRWTALRRSTQHFQLTLTEWLDQATGRRVLGRGKRLTFIRKDRQQLASVSGEDALGDSLVKQTGHGLAFVDESPLVAFRLGQGESLPDGLERAWSRSSFLMQGKRFQGQDLDDPALLSRVFRPESCKKASISRACSGCRCARDRRIRVRYSPWSSSLNGGISLCLAKDLGRCAIQEITAARPLHHLVQVATSNPVTGLHHFHQPVIHQVDWLAWACWRA